MSIYRARQCSRPKRTSLITRAITVSTISIIGASSHAVRAQAPSAPTMHSWTAATSSSTVKWDAVTGATSYNVYRSTVSNGEGSTPLVSGVTGTTFNDSGLTNATTYFYQITAVNGSGESAKSTEVSCLPLAQPSSVAATAGNGAVGLTWSAVSGINLYKIYRGTHSGGEAYVGTANGTSYVDTGLTNGTQYYYKVTAFIAATSDESSYSTEVSATPLSSALVAPTLQATTTSSTIGLSWTSTSGASSYTVLRSTVLGGPYTTIATQTSTSYVDTPPLGTTTYYYAVVAVAGSGSSVNSNEVAANCASGISQVATADAWVLSSQPTRNLGTNYNLAVSAIVSSVEQTYLTFPISSLGSTVTSVQLKLYKYSGPAGTETVYGISPGSWSETGLNWNNQPSLTGATNVGTLSVSAGSQYYTLDVTSYVQQQITAGATSVSFAITSPATGQITYYARENGANAPQLVLTTSATTVPVNLTATPGEKQVLLTWNPILGASGYNVYHVTGSGPTYTKITTAAPVTANAYIDSGLSNGSAYNYVVTAIIGGVEGSYSSQASATPLAQDSYWTVTQPSNKSTPAPTIGTNTASFSVQEGSSLMTSAAVTGAVSSSTSSSSEANCGGTWTFTWTGTSWPSLYSITHLQKQIYIANINSGNGSASVSNTGSSTLVSAVWPTTATQVAATPSALQTFNTADLTGPVLASSTTLHTAGATPAPGSTTGSTTGWSESIVDTDMTTSAYTSQWFQSHFSSPSSIVLTFTVPTSDITVSSNLSSSTSNGTANAQGVVGDTFGGQ